MSNNINRIILQGVVFQGFTVDIHLGRYSAGGLPALFLIDSETGEPIAKCTINPDTEQEANVPDGCTVIKDWSENFGMSEFLIAHDVIDKLPITHVRCGFEIGHVHRLKLPADEAISLI